jgi:coenzyme F420-reducing hydrogenase delta subunit
MRDTRVTGLNEEALRAHVFYCSNHPDAGQLAMHCRGSHGDTIKTISLPCSGKVDLPYLLKAFETGADGVVILTCSKTECRHLEGTMRASKRAEAVESLLEEIGMGQGRIALIEWQGDGVEKVLREIGEFFDKVRTLPQLSIRTGGVRQEESASA